jgi:hypothetical protein
MRGPTDLLSAFLHGKISRVNMWCGYKITGLNFFLLPVNFATSISVWYWLVLSHPFTVTISGRAANSSAVAFA